MLPSLRTHHIGVLVKDIGRALPRYVDHLGYEVRSALVHDPIQNAYVQFLALPGESALLELIAPDDPQSHLARMLKSNAGINHICYATPNLDDTMAQLRDCGLVTVRAPEPAVAFNGRRIAWLMNRDQLLIELVEQGAPGEL
jgi:methylmalonyl-CoA/ethylmalonyl-CoA epimerase